MFGLYYKLLYICNKFTVMENKPITNEESMQIITEMIETSKNNLKDNGFIWLMWGWLVTIASMFQFISMEVGFRHGYLAWVLMPLGGVITIWYSIRKSKESNVRTHVDTFMKSLWTAFGIAIVLVISMVSQHDELMVLPLCMMLYGIGTFVSGGALKFKPLKAGGLICFFCAAIAFNVGPQYQLLLISIAVIASYIIPGYILKSEYRKSHV